ncbi:MAG: SGNH/GDSL hydrolase family protein, partial [Candidatus Thiosymbion ectosymbiont of Robbea hypermnestra]|nr:SGNH/GDSL hydrolase family protein [Candidatus Thiosymbion ectosymbiont of Robbea hypermnestra]
GLRTGWLILGILLLLIVLGEAGLRLALTARDWLLDRPLTEHQVAEDKIDRWARADAYQGATWTHGYFRELERVRPFPWQPYVYWRRPPYQGRYIRVDRNGLRATWNPPSRDDILDDPPPVRIFAFGGSTMWGWGARDDYTIASHLSKLLHARGYRAEVTNYGQLGYVSTQEAIVLLRGIHRGERPDIALFYDGINEVFASAMNAAAGIPQNEWRRHAEFALLDRPRRLSGNLGRRFLDRNLWGFERFLAGLRRRVRSPADDRLQARPPGEEVVRQTLHIYAANLAFIASLGRRYGFESLFYWQPNLFFKRHRSPSEQAAPAAEGLTIYEEAFAAIYREVRQSTRLNGHPGFHDISALFEALEAPYYVDVTHLSEPGNRLVAQAMVNDVIELIERRRQVIGKENKVTAPPLTGRAILRGSCGLPIVQD